MSTDYDLLCDACRKYHHLGQHMAATFSTGYGSGDDEKTQQIGRFIQKHLSCVAFLRLVVTDAIPEGYKDAELPRPNEPLCFHDLPRIPEGANISVRWEKDSPADVCQLQWFNGRPYAYSRTAVHRRLLDPLLTPYAEVQFLSEE